MKGILLRFISSGLIFAVSYAAPSLFAQEIRRALPVDQPTPSNESREYENPEWMNKVPRATLVEKPTPEVIHIPQEQSISPSPSHPESTPTPTLIQHPTAEDYRSSTPAKNDAVTDGEIRLLPSRAIPQSGSNILENANRLFARKDYPSAILEYERFLTNTMEPRSKGRDEALFFLAESYRLYGNESAAQSAYERLVEEFDKGNFVGLGAFRLGETQYFEDRIKPALESFRLAYSNSTDTQFRLHARLNQAQCLVRLNHTDEAEPILAEIATVKVNNPFRNQALLSLGEIQEKKGKFKEALTSYLAIAEETKPPMDKARALMKAGDMAMKLNDYEQARSLFKQVFTMPGIGDDRGIAQFKMILSAYNLGDYKWLGSLTTNDLATIPQDFKPEAWLRTGQALRQLGQNEKAKVRLEQLITDFPDSPNSIKAKYERLLTLYYMGSKDTLSEIDSLLTSRKPIPKEDLTNLFLLKAELLFNNKEFAQAAKVYQSLEGRDFSEDRKIMALFKQGWSETEAKDYDQAEKTLSRFIATYPDDEQVPKAIAKRAWIRQSQKKVVGAIEDFDLLISKYPDSKEREWAILNKANLLAQKDGVEASKSSYEQLLKEYPKTSAAAEANFWLGMIAIDAKQYPDAITYLNKARELNPKQYGERASRQIIAIYQNQNDYDAAIKETTKLDLQQVSPGILRWLGLHLFDQKRYTQAEKYLLPLSASGSTQATPEILLMLSKSQIAQKKWKSAEVNIQRFLDLAHDPLNRARGLLTHAEILMTQKQFEEASKLADEAMLLQPEGEYNARGRMMLADISSAKGEHLKAANAYANIALLYDDKEITPTALDRAHKEFLLANRPMEAEKIKQDLNKRYPDYVSNN